MRKAEKIKRAASAALFRRSKVNQSRLLSVQFQPVSRQSLPEHG
jgi:hypothetical protein